MFTMLKTKDTTHFYIKDIVDFCQYNHKEKKNFGHIWAYVNAWTYFFFSFEYARIVHSLEFLYLI